MSDAESTKKIFFKKARPKSQRKCLASDVDNDKESDEESLGSKLLDTKVLQRLRERPHGVNISGLSSGQEAPRPESNVEADPFKMKTGGMINMKNVNITTVDDGIGTQFSAETNKRDEDDEMMKYIEQELSRKKQAQRPSEASQPSQHSYLTPEDAALAALPDHLAAVASRRSEEMLSNQMLSGIPEIDLGIESKIRNIEATEEAKLKMLLSKGKRSDAPSQFVPTNITVNFAQANKINAEEAEKRRAEKRAASDGSRPAQRATDDFLYEKFKKQFRRY